MSERPEDRYPTAAALSHDLERVMRRPRILLAGALAVAATVLIAFGVAASLRFLLPSADVATANLEIQVSRHDSYLDLHDALPLRTRDDRLQILARVPPGREGALYHLNPVGEPVRLQPERSPGDRFTRLVYPGGGGHVPFDRELRGTELVLLCVGRSSGDFDGVEDLLREVRDLPVLPPRVLVWLSRDEPRRETRAGSPLGPPEPDPVAQVEHRLDRLRQKLRDRFEDVRGVAFSHR
jgi:hypothetical protein